MINSQQYIKQAIKSNKPSLMQFLKVSILILFKGLHYFIYRFWSPSLIGIVQYFVIKFIIYFKMVHKSQGDESDTQKKDIDGGNLNPDKNQADGWKRRGLRTVTKPQEYTEIVDGQRNKIRVYKKSDSCKIEKHARP